MTWVARVLAIIGMLASFAFGQGATMSEPVRSQSRVIVTSEPGLERVAAQLEQAADVELDRIADDLTDLPLPAQIKVVVVRDAASLATIEPSRGAPPWAIGIAYPDLGVVGVALRRGANVEDPMTTLRHELAHVALGAALAHVDVPHWLHEGFAYQHSGEWSMDRAETLAGMAWFHGVIPIADLDHNFPAEESPAQRAYAESYDFVGFLSRRGRWEDTADDGDRWPFRRFLAEVGHGASLDAAAQHQFGKPIAGLFEEWRDDLQRRYFTAPIGLLGLAVWCACAILLAFAWWRRRRINRRRIAQWDLDERARDVSMQRFGIASIAPPPYVRWPGEDPFAERDDDRDDPPPDVVN
jgi:Peptidase MA superfamily